MENINSLLLVAQVVLSVSLITLILMQHGKGADAGAAFGGGGGGGGASGSVFGSKGSGNFLSRTTAVLATLFFVVSMSLAYVSSNRVVKSSVTDMANDQAPVTTIMQPMIESPDLPPVEFEPIIKQDDFMSDLPPQ